MRLVKWAPFHDINRFISENDWLGHEEIAVDLYREGDKLIAEMMVPGVEAKDIEVSIEKDLLRIKGHREETQETKGKDYFSKEISRGSFERVVGLPGEVGTQDADATYKDGMLRVTMSLHKAKESNRVKVRVH